MAVTTYNKLYTLAKDNEFIVAYNRPEVSGGVINIRGTLQKEFIPDSAQDLKTYDIAICLGEWQLSGGDPDDLLNDPYEKSQLDPSIKSLNRRLEGLDLSAWMAYRSMEESNKNPPDWIKIYSTNYGDWANLRINDILSVRVI